MLLRLFNFLIWFLLMLNIRLYFDNFFKVWEGILVKLLLVKFRIVIFFFGKLVSEIVVKLLFFRLRKYRCVSFVKSWGGTDFYWL